MRTPRTLLSWPSIEKTSLPARVRLDGFPASTQHSCAEADQYRRHGPANPAQHRACARAYPEAAPTQHTAGPETATS